MNQKHFIATFIDISEQKRLEKALLQSNQELETFAYVASHDMQEHYAR
jgi:light-regulated signal transduction histidine kinase (bacteriophytochrome)